MMVKMMFPDIHNDDKFITAADPCCGTGRFSLYTLIQRKNIAFYSNDVDIDLIRAAALTHWIYFPMDQEWVKEDKRFWFFLRMNSLSHPVGSDSTEWLFSNRWDQPASLLEAPDSRGYTAEEVKMIFESVKGEPSGDLKTPTQL